MSVRAWWKRMTGQLCAASSGAGQTNSADALGRRLRRKFILVAMGAVTVVLTLIIAGINIVNYSHICKISDVRLDYILAGKDGIGWTYELSADSGVGMGVESGKGVSGDRASFFIGHFEGMTAESPFDTRYFTVTARPQGFLVTTAIRLHLKAMRPPMCLSTVRAN